MIVLCLDVGSSSVKAGLVQNDELRGKPCRVAFPTRYTDDRAEVRADHVLNAIAEAVQEIGKSVRRAEVIALTAMSPSWIAMDRRGKPLTPVITHQDRRSIATAHALLKRVGASRWLKSAGNLPFPGGISATTWAWHLEHAASVMSRADLVGHLQTYIHRQMNGSRVIDPSNASFTGLYRTISQGGWSDSMIDAIGARSHQLPQILEADQVAGFVSHAAAARFGLVEGTPMLTGCIDTSAAMFFAGARPGQLLNIAGSTDVLALCTDAPTPHPKLLTRALGTGKRWMSVGTLAAVGSALNWAQETLYADHSREDYFKIVDRIASRAAELKGGVSFDPYLAGDRTSIDQKRAAFTGLTLATSREQMLAAVLDALAVVSGARIDLLKEANQSLTISRKVFVGGGSATGGFAKLLYRDWPGKWSFRHEIEPGLRGLYRMAEQRN